MAIFTIIKDFLVQFISDFETYTVEYLLIFIAVILIVGVIKK